MDFEPDLELLGCALTYTYHNDRHVAIGNDTGDMSFPPTAPKDPIFWRLHKFIDNISMKRFFPAVTDTETITTQDTIPPRVFSQNPFRLNPYITGLTIDYR